MIMYYVYARLANRTISHAVGSPLGTELISGLEKCRGGGCWRGQCRGITFKGGYLELL